MKIIICAFLIVLTFNSSALAQEYYYQNQKKVPLERYTYSSRKNTATIIYYKNQQGDIFGITDQIILKISDESQIGIYAKEFNLSIEKKLSKSLYLVKIPDKNLTLKTANSLSLQKDIVYAHPDFIKAREPR